MAFTQVTITQDYTSADWTEPSGTVTFTPTTPMRNDTVVVPAVPVAARLDGGGAITIDLAANTDDDTAPAGASYQVDELINNIRRSFYVIIPHDQGSTLTLYDLTQITTAGLPSFPGWLGGGQFLDVRNFGAVGSGSVDDQPALQAAVLAASAAKTPLYLPPGTYRCDTQLVLASDLTLFGAGASSIISGNLASADSLIRSPLSSATSNIVLRDFKVDRTGTNVQHGLRIRNCTNLRIQGLEVIGSNSASMQGGAIVIGGFASPTSGETCYNVHVTGCYFEAADNFCVQFGSVVGGVIANNRAVDCYREVYGVEPGSGFEASNIAITGNVVQTGSTFNDTSTDTGVIVVTTSSGGTIRDVTVTGNAVEGTEVISSNVMAGILVVGGDAVTVAGNVCRNLNGPGIAVGVASFTTAGTVVSGNVVRDCNQGGNSTPHDVGVRIRNASNVLVTGNRISGSGHRVAVEETSMSGTPANLIANNYIVGNTNRVGTLASGTQWVNNLFSASAGAQEMITGLTFFDGRNVEIGTSTGTRFGASGSKIGWFGATPAAKPSVSGSRGGNAALASLLTQLATLGLITDSTSA